MGTLLDALNQENLDNQREVVKNEKRWSYDNRPYGSWYEKIQGHLYPPDHPYHHTTIGSMEDLDAASIEDVSAFFRTYYAPNNAVLSGRRRRRARRDPALDRALLRRHPGQPGHPAARRPVAAADPRRARSARPSTTRSRCPGSTSGSGRPAFGDDAARRPRHRRPGPRRRQGLAPPPPARPRRADRPGRRARRRSASSAGRRSASAGRPSGRAIPVERVEAALHEELERLGARADQRRRARPGPRPDRDRGARRPVAGRGAGRSALDVRDAVRRSGPDQPDAAALPGGHGRADPGRRRGDVSAPTTGSS